MGNTQKKCTRDKKIFDRIKEESLKYHIQCKQLSQAKLLKLQNERHHGWNPLPIFPEDVWIYIFKYVKDREARTNLSKTCVLFEKLIKEPRVQNLFGEILPVVIKYLKKTEILFCRLVCRSWYQHINQYVENNPLMEVTTNAFPYKAKTYVFQYEIQPRDNVRYGRCWTKFKQFKGNPFVGRTVALCLDRYHQSMYSSQNFEEDKTSWTEFFKSFGQYIYTVRTTGYWAILSPEEFYWICTVILTNCPNLKTLELGCITFRTETFSTTLPVYPDHSNLRELSFNTGADFDESLSTQRVFDMLVRKYSSQLTSVKLLNTIGITELLKLNWERLHSFNLVRLTYPVKHFKLSPMIAPNVNFVCIDEYFSKFLKLSLLIKFLACFPVLHSIRIAANRKMLPVSESEIDKLKREQGAVCIPSVKHIEVQLRCYKNETKFDFLAFFPRTKKLTLLVYRNKNISVLQRRESEKYLLIDISKYLTNCQCQRSPSNATLHTSNIWTVLPYLDEIELTVDYECCTEYGMGKQEKFLRQFVGKENKNL